MKRWGICLGVVVALVAVVVIVYFLVIGKSGPTCYTDEGIEPYLFLASRTTYTRAHGHDMTRRSMDPSCKPVQIWTLIRHGARYPEPKLIEKFRRLEKLRNEIVDNHVKKGRGKLCDSDLEHLMQWQLIPDADSIPPAELTQNGAEELHDFGRRLKHTYPELLAAKNFRNVSQADYKFRGTNEERTQDSLTAFMEGVFEGEGVTIKPEETPQNDSLLYVNKNCPKYQASLLLNPWDKRDAFEQAPEFLEARRRVSERLGFDYVITKGTIKLMFEICRYETAWLFDSEWSAWCLAFEPEDIKVMEFHEDIGTYYYAGPGRPINKMIACPTVKDLIFRFRNVVKNGPEASGEPKGVFYFGHTVMLAATMGALGLTETPTPFLPTSYSELADRKFRTSLVGPFSGNLVAVLYRCNAENKTSHKVTLHASEREWPVPGCGNGAYCDWETFERKYAETADKCNMDFCYQ